MTDYLIQPVYISRFRKFIHSVNSNIPKFYDHWNVLGTTILNTDLQHLGDIVAPSGLVNIVITIGPKVRWFKPGRRRWFFKGYKNPSTTFFGGKVKPSAPCGKILRHIKNPYRYGKRYLVGKIYGNFSPCFPALLLAAFAGNYQRALVHGP
jgi:hypothetical protein